MASKDPKKSVAVDAVGGGGGDDEDHVAEEDDEQEDDEEDLEKLQAEIARMEEEAARITKETEELERKKALAADSKKGDQHTATSASVEKPSNDGYSIYVGQVDYNATPEELLAHFEACGTVERVTIVCDKYTGRPKGFAYIEFQTDQAVENAVKLDGSEFKGRALKITRKRVNVPGFHATAGGGGGRGSVAGRAPYRGGGGGMVSAAGGGPPPTRGGYRGGFRGRGRGGFRGGGGGGGARGYHPYY